MVVDYLSGFSGQYDIGQIESSEFEDLLKWFVGIILVLYGDGAIGGIVNLRSKSSAKEEEKFQIGRWFR